MWFLTDDNRLLNLNAYEEIWVTHIDSEEVPENERTYVLAATKIGSEDVEYLTVPMEKADAEALLLRVVKKADPVKAVEPKPGFPASASFSDPLANMRTIRRGR